MTSSDPRPLSMAATVLALLSCWSLPPGTMAEPSTQARRLAQEFIIIDGHIDAPYHILLRGADLASGENSVQFDYERARAGGLDAPFLSIYVPPEKEASGGAKAQADMLLGLVEGVVALHPDKFEIARSTDDVRRIHGSGKIAFPLGMENGSPIEGDLDNLRHFYQRGIRYITLAHSRANHISDSSYDDNERWNGLSPFGFLLVRAMNELGIMVDVSHLTDRAIEDVLATSVAPVIASHSSLRHFVPDFHRNLPDRLVQEIARQGGVIMINFGSAFVTAEANRYSQTIKALRAGSDPDDSARVAAVEKWRNRNPYPYATLEDVLDHIDRVVQLSSVDHVGFGSDFDGVGDSLPENLKDVADYPNLIQGLLDRGYASGEIRKMAGENLLRVWGTVEDLPRKVE